MCRIVLALGCQPEQRLGHGHNQRRRNAFAAHVTDAEEEFLVSHKEVVEVATHLLGRSDEAGYLGTVHAGKRLWYHGTLNIVGHTELAPNVFLSQPGFAQSACVAHKPENQENHHGQCQQVQHGDVESHVVELTIDLVVVAHNGYNPVRVAPDVGEKNVGVVAIYSRVKFYDFASSASAQSAKLSGVVDKVGHNFRVFVLANSVGRR